MKRKALALLIPLLIAAEVARADDAPPGGAPAAPAASPGAVDVVVLKDGRRLEGEVVAEDDRFVSLKSGGVTRAYAKDSIASIERAPRSGTDAGVAPKPTPPGAELPGKDKKKEKGDRRDAPLSDSAKAWLDGLIAKTADPDDAIRRSVGAAIGAMGPQAIPAVRAAEAAAPEGAQRQFLGKLASDMEARRDKRGRGEPAVPGDGMGPGGAMPGQEPGMPREGRFGGPRRALEEMMQRLSADLELRDDQKPKVEPILAEAMKKRFELFRDARRDGLTAEQVAARVTPLRSELLAQMKPVLDEPQYALFEEMANRFFDAPPRGPGQSPPPAKPDTPPAPEPVK